MWNANQRVNEKLSDRENRFLPCRASFIIKMRIIIPLYIQFSAGLCNLQLTQSNRKIKDIFWIKTKALGRLPALTVSYTLCSSEEAKKHLSRELRVAFPIYFLGEGTSSRYKPLPVHPPPALDAFQAAAWWAPSPSVRCRALPSTAGAFAGAVLSALSYLPHVLETLMPGRRARHGPLRGWKCPFPDGDRPNSRGDALKQQVCRGLFSSISPAILTCTAVSSYPAFKRKVIARDTF